MLENCEESQPSPIFKIYALTYYSSIGYRYLGLDSRYILLIYPFAELLNQIPRSTSPSMNVLGRQANLTWADSSTVTHPDYYIHAQRCLTAALPLIKGHLYLGLTVCPVSRSCISRQAEYSRRETRVHSNAKAPRKCRLFSPER